MKTRYLKQFEQYYNGEMEPHEKAAFEESLQNDPDLKASFQEYLEIYDAISDTETLDLRSKLKEIREENSRPKSSGDFFSQGYNWLWMAALITAIISFTTLVGMLVRRIEFKEMFAYSYSLYDKQDTGGLDRELSRFGRRLVQFNVESPKDSVYLSRTHPVLFSWNTVSTEPLILDLIDGQGDIVYSSFCPIESPYVVDAKLPAGIIAYRFRTQSEVFRIGFLYFR
jgi:hypothetical protein